MRNENAMAIVIVVLLAVIGLLAYERHDYMSQTPGEKIGRAIDSVTDATKDLAHDMKDAKR